MPDRTFGRASGDHRSGVLPREVVGEVAEIVGIPENTVKTRMFYAARSSPGCSRRKASSASRHSSPCIDRRVPARPSCVLTRFCGEPVPTSRKTPMMLPACFLRSDLHGGKIITLDRASRVAQASRYGQGTSPPWATTRPCSRTRLRRRKLIDLQGPCGPAGLLRRTPACGPGRPQSTRRHSPSPACNSVADIVAVVQRAAQARPPASGSCSCPWASRRTSTSAAPTN